MRSPRADEDGRTGEPLLIDETRHARLIELGEAELAGTPSPLWMGAPLKTDRGVFGVVAVQSYDDPTLYTEKDLGLLHVAAGTIAIALERTRAVDALRNSEERDRLLFERNLAGVHKTTIDGHILECNPAFASILGYSRPEDVRNISCLDLYDDVNVWRSYVTELQRSGSVNALEHQLVRNNGSPVWVLLSASLTEDQDKNPTIIETSLIDISERQELGDPVDSGSEARGSRPARRRHRP